MPVQTGKSQHRFYRLAFLVAILALSGFILGCVPRLQQIGPVVSQPSFSDDLVRTGDGVALSLRQWLPADRSPHAVVIALHGFNDYHNAFSGPAQVWATSGIAVYAYDQRGFGKAPNPGLWAGDDVLVEDLKTVTELVARDHPDLPIFWLGTSMGGAVVMAALAEEEPIVTGAVLVAPAVWGRATMPLTHRVALWVSAHTVPWVTVTGRGLDIVPSDNIEMLRDLGRDPLVLKETRIDAIHGVVNLMDRALLSAPRIHSPLLVLYGAHDDIIPKEPTRLVVDLLSTKARVAVYETGFHMLLRDLNADIVLHDIAAWIADQGAMLPSGAEQNVNRFFSER